MKLLIIGASGSGTTTLAKELAKETDYIHLDVDDYYWKPTDLPYQIKIPLNERAKKLQTDFEKHKKVIVSGSLVSWGKYWLTAFDLVIFTTLEKEIRMQRLQQREQQRYGTQLQNDPIVQERSQAFLAWAARYDDQNFTGRSIKTHRDWLTSLTCKIIEVDNKERVKTTIRRIINELSKHKEKI